MNRPEYGKYAWEADWWQEVKRRLATDYYLKHIGLRIDAPAKEVMHE